MTHELFLHALRAFIVPRLNDVTLGGRLASAKLLYGTGRPGLRGMCIHDAWRKDQLHDVIEICALGEESQLQLAGTALHEFGHCLAAWGAGHGKAWKAMTKRVGLRHALAAGQHYRREDFAPEILQHLADLGPISDGEPAGAPTGGSDVSNRCPLGVGTRRGTSRGPGSGSRLRLFVCACPVRVRVARDEFHARCLTCDHVFQRDTQ
jgi:hypothetical protein